VELDVHLNACTFSSSTQQSCGAPSPFRNNFFLFSRMGIFVIMLASSTTAPSSDRSADAFSAHEKLNQMFFFSSTAPHASLQSKLCVVRSQPHFARPSRELDGNADDGKCTFLQSLGDYVRKVSGFHSPERWVVIYKHFTAATAVRIWPHTDQCLLESRKLAMPTSLVCCCSLVATRILVQEVNT